jgi:acyl transferase domain-containing protein
MARDLYQAEKGFRETVDRGLRALAPLIDYDLKEVLFPAKGKEDWAKQRFQRPSVQLPAIFIIEYALARLLMARGITPKALVGHSLGENTAACLAEVFSFEDGVALVHKRGTLFDGVPAGGMLSVPLARQEVERLLGADLDLACVNGANLCVVSGPDAPLAALQKKLAASDVEAQRVPIDIAAHSRMLEGILGQWRSHLRSLRLSPPKIPFISNRSGTWIKTEEATDPEYWVQHLRHTVHFAEGVATLAQEHAAVFVEVGPGKTLGSLAKQNPAVNSQKRGVHAAPPRREGGRPRVPADRLREAVGARPRASAERLWPGETRRRVPLPTYAFQGQRYWIEPTKPQAVASAPAMFPEKLADLEQWFYAPVWRRLDPEADGSTEKRSWLVFVDETGFGKRWWRGCAGAATA